MTRRAVGDETHRGAMHCGSYACDRLGAIFVTALVASPIAATAQVSLDVTVAPPPPRYEAVPPPRPGYVWAPGYWNRTGTGWDWRGGRWVGAEPGSRWAADTWVQAGPRWHYVPGHWGCASDAPKYREQMILAPRLIAMGARP
jgi:hypothetical protein